MTTQPTILLTFAQNDLRQVAEEARNLRAIVSQQAVLKCQFIENVSASTLENAVTECDEALAFFHFSGHANETGLMLSDENYLNSGRLYRILFGKSEQLQFVFLNGCHSYGHAGYLIASGVKAVIIANTDVPDEIARRLAERFYELFLLKACALGEAFKRAEASVNSGYLPHIIQTNPAELLVGQTAPSQWSLLIYDKFREVEHWTIHDFLVAFQKRPVESPYVPFLVGLHHDKLLVPEAIINAMLYFSQRSDYEKTILSQLAIMPPQNIAYQTLLDLLQPSKMSVFEALLLQLQLKDWIFFDPNQDFKVNPVLQVAVRAQQQLINSVHKGKYKEVLSEIKSLKLNDKVSGQLSSILEKAKKQAESQKYYKKTDDIQQEPQSSSASNHFEPTVGQNGFIGRTTLIDWKLIVFVSTFMIAIGMFVRAILAIKKPPVIETQTVAVPESSASGLDKAKGGTKDTRTPSGKKTNDTEKEETDNSTPSSTEEEETAESLKATQTSSDKTTEPSNTKGEQTGNPTPSNETPKPSNQIVKETDCMLTTHWHTILLDKPKIFEKSGLIDLPNNQKFKILDKKIDSHMGAVTVFYEVEYKGFKGWVQHDSDLEISAECYYRKYSK